MTSPGTDLHSTRLSHDRDRRSARRAEHYARAVRALSRKLTHSLDVRGVLRAVHREMERVLDATIVLFGIFDAATQTVSVVWQIHDGRELPGGSFPLGDGFTSRVIRTGEPLLIRDWSASGPPVQVHYATEHVGLPQSTITAPVRYDQQVRGVLSVQSYETAAFDEDDLAFLGAVADQAGKAIFGHVREPAPPDAAVLAPILAKVSIGVLVLDRARQLVYMNGAARRLLCLDGRSLILGYPIDQAQDDGWPLGTRALTDAIRSILDRLSEDQPSTEEIAVEGASGNQLACSASVLFTEGTISGELLLLRKLRTPDAV